MAMIPEEELIKTNGEWEFLTAEQESKWKGDRDYYVELRDGKTQQKQDNIDNADTQKALIDATLAEDNALLDDEIEQINEIIDDIDNWEE